MISGSLKLDKKWSDLNAYSIEGAAQQKILCVAFTASADLKSNYTQATNFLFEDSLHLFAAKGTSALTLAPDITVQNEYIKEICNKTNFPPGNTETGIFFLCVFPYEYESGREVRSISTGLGCLRKMIAFFNT